MRTMMVLNTENKTDDGFKSRNENDDASKRQIENVDSSERQNWEEVVALNAKTEKRWRLLTSN